MKRVIVLLISFLAVSLIFCLPGCTGGGSDDPAPPKPVTGEDQDPTDPAPAGATGPSPAVKAALEKFKDDFELPMVEYQWDPGAGDSSVSAELGGPGFTGEGWTTRMKYPGFANPKAPQGGHLSTYIGDWPATLRLAGKDYNSAFNYMVRDLCQETLLGLSPVTLEFTPSIATHWHISDDKQTYRFRINPAARWNDGSEITSEDVVATWKLMMDEKLLFPSNILVFEKYNEPKAISKYIVEVTAKVDNWRNFLYFAASMQLFKKADCLPGDQFLKKFNNAYPAISGPYEVKLEDIDLGKSLKIRRRSDWWAENNPAKDGLYNIGEYRIVVVRDLNLAFEKAKKGELDLFVVPKAQWWAQELDKVDAVQRGLLQKRKLYTDAPIGTSGIAINMSKKPLDDVRIRKALQYLENRELMIEKFYFNEYYPLTSYYQGGTYQNPDNQHIPYDELAAVELLEAAGWGEMNDELIRVKNGQELKFKLMYRSKLSERSLTTFQENCKRAGIKIELNLLTPAAAWKNLTEMEYELASIAWGATKFPNPETSWHSSLADKTGNNNVTAFKNEDLDKLLDEYDRAYEVRDRIKVIQKIDAILYKEHPYVLDWYLPSQRFIYWNKIGMPSWGTGRVYDRDEMHYCWWIDPDKEEALEAARSTSTGTMPIEEVENHFWPAWNHLQRQANR